MISGNPQKHLLKHATCWARDPSENPAENIFANVWWNVKLQSTTALLSRLWESLHRGVHDIDHGLKRALGHGLQGDHKHIVEVHEPLTDFPLLGGGAVDGV
jgi:hypothetical protein